MYRQARDVDERERLLGALGYAGAGGQVSATLALALGPEVRAQDVRLLVLTVAEQSSAEAAWAWLKASYEPLRAKLGGGWVFREEGGGRSGVGAGWARPAGHGPH